MGKIVRQIAYHFLFEAKKKVAINNSIASTKLAFKTTSSKDNSNTT